MDLNLATTTTALVNSNQENNQLLLNAIKNKFAAQTAQEAAAFSPPKFNIPLLKIPADNTNTNCSSRSNTPPNTQLNQFLLKQLQEKHTNKGKDQESTGFVLPQLQFNNNSNNNKNGLKFELPAALQQKPLEKDNKVSSLTSAINKLQVLDVSDTKDVKLPSLTNSANIDLTTALSCKKQSHQGTPPTRDFGKSCTKSNNQELDFDIPFIDCDRFDSTRKHDVLLPLSNEYCITDISQLLLKHSLVETPSVIGRFLCLADDKYLPPGPLKCLSKEYRQQPVKHYIAPFRFETKSPDDIVLEALNKYQRRHYN